MLFRNLALVMTFAILASASGAFAQQPDRIAEKPQPVPGQCTEPASLNIGKPGCFLTTTLTVNSAPSRLYWHVYSVEQNDKPADIGTTPFGQWRVKSNAHGKDWLYILGPRRIGAQSGKQVAIIGPLRLQPGKPVIARFIESTFPPGMKTRVHSHPGPEAFYVLDGVQCMQSPQKEARVGPGQTFIVPGNVAHVQSAPDGRRNLALVLHQPDAAWMAMETAWQPPALCQ